ncbi:unnamed protein product [Schistosoma margrebowiei]|uniref:Uncharacterized protein n=1 Tax=Schistosoma margrebowiei TaxID=48269 RepID=A0A3P7TRW9_9TREM|nr:unnamed protein product [Schistosoma margrebowiei]
MFPSWRTSIWRWRWRYSSSSSTIQIINSIITIININVIFMYISCTS